MDTGILLVLSLVAVSKFRHFTSFEKINNYNIRKHLQREKYNLTRIRGDYVLKRGMAYDEAQL